MPTVTVGPSGRDYTTPAAALTALYASTGTPAGTAGSAGHLDMGGYILDIDGDATYTGPIDLIPSAGWLLPVTLRWSGVGAGKPVIASPGSGSQAVNGFGAMRNSSTGVPVLQELILSGWASATNGVLRFVDDPSTHRGCSVQVIDCEFVGNTGRTCIKLAGTAANPGLATGCKFQTSGLPVQILSAFADFLNSIAVLPASVQCQTGNGRYVEHIDVYAAGGGSALFVGSATYRGIVTYNAGAAIARAIDATGGSFTECVKFGSFTGANTGTDGGGNQTADPQFTDGANADFTKPDTSPCFRSLARSANVLETYDGVLRSDPTDAGAYEYVETTTTVSSITDVSSTSIKLNMAAAVTSDASWTTAGNYTITSTGSGVAVSVSAAAITDAGMSVTLTTSEHTQSEGYDGIWNGLLNVTNGTIGYVGAGVAPSVSGATSSVAATVRVSFSEAMSATGLSTAGNYTIAPVVAGGPAVSVSAATPGGGNTWVDLTVSGGLAGKLYEVTVSASLKDVALNPIATRTATYTSPKATLTAATPLSSMSVSVTLSRAADPTGLTNPAAWSIARVAPLFGVTPTISSVALNSPTAPTVATLTTTAHTETQAYRVSAAGLIGVADGSQDYVGEGPEIAVSVHGFYFASTATAEVYVPASETWTAALLVTFVSDMELALVLPSQPADTETFIRVSVGGRLTTLVYTYP